MTNTSELTKAQKTYLMKAANCLRDFTRQAIRPLSGEEVMHTLNMACGLLPRGYWNDLQKRNPGEMMRLLILAEKIQDNSITPLARSEVHARLYASMLMEDMRAQGMITLNKGHPTENDNAHTRTIEGKHEDAAK